MPEAGGVAGRGGSVPAAASRADWSDWCGRNDCDEFSDRTDCDERIPGQTGTDHECPGPLVLLGRKGLSPLRQEGLVVVIDAGGRIAMNSAIVRIVTKDFRG